MKIVCIAGAISGVGKTTLAEKLLSRLDGWAACKVTVAVGGRRHRCPRGKADTCGVCASLKKDYTIEKDLDILAVPGKDTGRLLQAGAKKVLWVKARPSHLRPAIEEALRRLKGHKGVIFEGNHALRILDPDLAIMVLSPDGTFKRSATQVLDKVNIFQEQIDEKSVRRLARLLKNLDEQEGSPSQLPPRHLFYPD